jgi:serine-type D-Ala-D-Ala carboxypeptidase/endopeptidase
MKRKQLLTALALWSFYSSTSHAAPAPSVAKIKEVLHKCVETQHRVPAMVIGVIDKNSVTVLGLGKRADGSSDDVNGDTVFEIGSVTKVFTGLLLQDMADHDEVKLDDPITNYLPASVTVPSRNGGQITLRSLATHTSGLPRLPDNMAPKDDDNPYADYTVDQLYQFLSSYKLPRKIGAKSEYSNLGVGLLGHVLALKAGTNYEALVVGRICNPLKMDSTRVTLTPNLQARLAAGHNEAGVPAKNWDLPTLTGAGALRSTVNDMLKLLAAEMGFAPSPLSGAMQKTQAPQKPGGFLSEIGLAWQIDKDNGTIWHNGGTGGYISYVGFKQDKSLGVVILAGGANDIDDAGQFLLGDTDKLDTPALHHAVKIDYSVYDRYAGEYNCTWAPAKFVLTRDGDHLMAKLADQPAFEVYPESPTEFFYTVVDAQLTFATNGAGKVTHLILHQNGMNLKADKAK